jgi:flagellar biogenesis protein FliO
MAYVVIAKRLADKRLVPIVDGSVEILHGQRAARATNTNAITGDGLRGLSENFDYPNVPLMPQMSLKKALFKVAATLVLLGMLVCGITYLRRHNGRTKKVAKISIGDTLALGAKHHLAIAECEGRRYLIGIAPQTISYIDVLDSADTIRNISPGSRKANL